MIINSKGFGIPKSLLSDIELKKLRQDLTVKPLINETYVTDTGDLSFPVYRENKTRVYLPKFYGLNKYGHSNEIEFKERVGTDISFVFEGKVKPDQKEFIDSILNKMNTCGACIACAPTGSGKTVMAINVISVIKKKTLIIVHKDFLLDQWKERINQFMSGVKIGTIRQKIVDTDCDICIGMLQSISMKDYSSEVFDTFGLVIIDECHHISSKVFSKALFKVATRNLLGLSATPNRKDGLTIVLKWFMGDILIKEPNKDQDILTPTVRIIEAKYKNDIKIKHTIKGNVNVPHLITQLSEDKARNNLILKHIIDLYDSTNRNTLVLSDRRDQCNFLYNQLLKSGIPTDEVGLYLGQMKTEDLSKSNEARIILGTYSMISEGYDCPKLDTLILATGKSDLVQSVGRILRRKNVNSPLIIDIADKLYRHNQYQTRKRYYKSCKFNIIDETSNKGKKGTTGGFEGTGCEEAFSEELDEIKDHVVSFDDFLDE